MRYSPTLTSYQSSSAMDRWRDHVNRLGWGLWAVERRDTQEWIGFAGLSSAGLRAAHSPSVEVVWRFSFSNWRRGFATEAAMAAVRAGFDYLLLDEITASLDARDQRSRMVAKRLGMREDNPGVADPDAVCEVQPGPRRVLRLSRSAPTLRSFADPRSTESLGFACELGTWPTESATI